MEFARKSRLIAALLLGLPLLAGCASSVALTRPARDSVGSLSMNKEVKLPDDINYYGSGQSAGALFGPIGVLVAAAAAKGPKAQLQVAMREALRQASIWRILAWSVARRREPLPLRASGATRRLVLRD